MKHPDNEIITEIEINGLHGRMFHVEPSTEKNREILLVAGLHTSIERMKTTAQFHSRYGSVTMPDLPGFGGMDSFYSIGMEPNLDNYADYLYTFIRSRSYKKKITLISMSFGFLIVTRMLQKYPEMKVQVQDNVSFVGFGRHTDFLASEKKKKLFRLYFMPFKTKLGAFLVKTFIFNPITLRGMFLLFRLINPKYKELTAEKRKASVDMELQLWQWNDARTKFYTYNLIFNLDLTKGCEPIDMVVNDLHSPNDQYFSDERVAKTMKLLYKNHKSSVSATKLHAPSVIGTVEDVAKIYSSEIKELLSKS